VHWTVPANSAGAAGIINLTLLIRRLTLPFAIVTGLTVGLAASASWDTTLQFLHATKFGTADPIWGRDVGYYVFTLPTIEGAVGLVRGIAVFMLIVLVPIYALRGDIIPTPPRQIRIEPSAATHLAIVVALIFALTALRLWLVDVPNLLYSTTGPLVGASYTDLHATLPMLYLSAVVALLAAGAVLLGNRRGQLARYAIISVAVYLGVTLIGRGLVPSVIQKLIVAPTELTRETPYLRHHIAATRAAWGIDSVEVKDLGDASTLTLADIQANGPTIDNVRLWDRDPLLQTFGQLQEIRTYYTFLSVDDDR
jgi:hypothetical protein